MNKRKRKKLDKKLGKQELFGKRKITPLDVFFNSMKLIYPVVLFGEEEITLNHEVLSNMRYLYPMVFIIRDDPTTGEKTFEVVEDNKREGEFL